MVCDYWKRFLDVVIKFPGSAHDSRIWRESSLGRAMEASKLHKNVTFILHLFVSSVIYVKAKINTDMHLTKCKTNNSNVSHRTDLV